MLCQSCLTNEANVIVTKSMNGIATELRLCSNCASAQGIIQVSQEPFSLHQFVLGMLAGEKTAVNNRVVHKEIECPTCHMTMKRFSEFGKFGCQDCYTTFNENLPLIIKNFQGGNHHHKGMVPSRFKPTDTQVPDKIHTLTQQLAVHRIHLQNHILAEEFELAALARDKIRQILQQIREASGDDN